MHSIHGKVMSSRLRATLAIALLWATACATVIQTPPPNLAPYTSISVFCDGFHSGLLIPVTPETSFLDGREGDPPSKSPYYDVGFGAESWDTSPVPRILLAAKLVCVGGPGVTYIGRSWARRPGVPGGPPVRQWWFEIDRGAWARVVCELRKRVPADACLVRPQGAYEYVIPADARWTILDNCHDFCRHMLAVVGLELSDPVGWTTASSFCAEMDSAQSYLEENGISVLGSPPEPECALPPPPADPSTPMTTASTHPCESVHGLQHDEDWLNHFVTCVGHRPCQTLTPIVACRQLGDLQCR